MTSKPMLAVTLFVSLTLSISFVFAQENWVEVLRTSGHGANFGDSPPFYIEHVDWRIRWEYNPL